MCSEYFVNNLDRHQRPIILPYDVDGAEKSYKMLQHMVRIGCWSEESFQIVMRAFLQRGRVRWKLGQTETFTCAADQLELLLLELEQIIEVTETISEETMRLVLQAYAVCATPRGERNYAMRAEELLQRMEHTTESLLLIIHAWAWQQANKEMGDCAKKAEEYLIQLEELTDDPVIRQQAYDYVLEAWSKSKDAPEKANAIFEKRQKLGHVSMDCYTNIILSWSKSPGGAQRANDLLNEMLDMFHRGIFPAGQEPELIAFNSVITSWGKAQRPDTGELILHLLEETSRKCTKLVPNVLTYNAVIHAHYLSSNSKVALERGQALVQYMEVHALEEPEIQPDIFTYNTLMKAWVKSGHPELVENAERILFKMERLASTRDDSAQLTSRNFNIVLNAYSKSKNRFAGQKAFALLDRMRKSTTIQPDVVSYTSVMECYSKSTEPDAAAVVLELLQELQKKHETTNDPNLMPNARTYTMAILALARCPQNGNAKRARDLLIQLNELYKKTKDESLKPNAYTYNYVLNCAANTVGTKEDKISAFQVAAKTYHEMRGVSYIDADSFTYGFWIKACNNLLPPSTDLYEKFVVLAFEECQKGGLVNQEVLTRLQQGHLSKERLSEIFKVKMSFQSRISVEDIPPAWSRNSIQDKPNRANKKPFKEVSK